MLLTISWFIDHLNRDSRTDILESAIHADAEKLEDLLCTWLTNTISCFDEQENYYHGFVTGLVSGFNGYMVVSNRESGNGRFDLVVKQRSRWHHAAILEFKVVEKYNQMTKACEDALRQIEEKTTKQACGTNSMKTSQSLEFVSARNGAG